MGHHESEPIWQTRQKPNERQPAQHARKSKQERLEVSEVKRTCETASVTPAKVLPDVAHADLFMINNKRER